MKKLIKEFSSSIYNPTFYKQIHSKSLKSIFGYILKVNIFICAIVFISVAINTFFTFSGIVDMSNSLPVPGYILGYIIGIVSSSLVVFLTTFILWLIYGWLFGVIMFGVLFLLKSKITYTESVKIAMYAMSLGMILNIVPYLPYSSLLGIIVPILIVFINLKKQ